MPSNRNDNGRLGSDIVGHCDTTHQYGQKRKIMTHNIYPKYVVFVVLPATIIVTPFVNPLGDAHVYVPES